MSERTEPTADEIRQALEMLWKLSGPAEYKHKIATALSRIPGPPSEPDALRGALRVLDAADTTGSSVFVTPTEARTILAALRSTSCDVCGGRMVSIRGRYPAADNRIVCPTCLADRIEIIREYANGHHRAARGE